MFQISEPIAVYSVNMANGIRRNPAGIDTSERISGMQRPTSTATTARRSNQRVGPVDVVVGDAQPLAVAHEERSSRSGPIQRAMP